MSTTLLSLATLLSWFGAAYHDVWLAASEIVHHHHHHSHHHHHHSHDQDNHKSDDEDSQSSLLIPDFNGISRLSKNKLAVPKKYLEINIFLGSGLLTVWADVFFEFANAPPLLGIVSEHYYLASLQLAHSVQPNAPPISSNGRKSAFQAA